MTVLITKLSWLAVAAITLSLQVSFRAAGARLTTGLIYRQGQGSDVNQVISQFARGEAESREALAHYSYQQDLLVQSLDNGRVTGQFHRVSQISPGTDRKPHEKIVSFPASTLNSVIITKEDLTDLSALAEFTFGEANISKYKFQYKGLESDGGEDRYVFSAKPASGGRAHEGLFKGQIWIDVKTMRVVKLRGKWEHSGDDQGFPVLTMTRGVVDGYDFPLYTYADQTIDFPNAPPVHVRFQVRYRDFVKAN